VATVEILHEDPAGYTTITSGGRGGGGLKNGRRISRVQNDWWAESTAGEFININYRVTV
jgi:hypothetical protein